VAHLHVDLTIPDTVSDSLREALQQEAREQTVLALFRRGACSAGLAAQLLDLTYKDFLDFLKARGVGYAAGEINDTAADEATLRWLREQAPDKREPA
jgi:predicted HTH domain antitoxin